MIPPLRPEKGETKKLARGRIERWPNHDGLREAERLADVVMMPADEVPDTPMKWLWRDVLPRGHVTLVAGEPGSGKSFWMADLAARLSFASGWPYCDGDDGGMPDERPGFGFRNAATVIVNSDDAFVDVQQPRLAAGDAQLPLVGLMRRLPPGSRGASVYSVASVTARLEALRAAIKQAGDCRLAVIDDLAHFVRNGLGKVTRADLLLALEGLKNIAGQCDVAVVVVWRLERTGRATARQLEALLPAAAMAWLAGVDPYRPEQRWLVPLKNQFGPPPGPMAFHLAGNRVVWDEPPPSVPADVMAAFVRKSDRRLEREEAGRWALARLAEGPVEADLLWQDAEAFGFSRRTLRRALADLGLKPKKQGNDGPWVWERVQGSGFRVQGSAGKGRSMQIAKCKLQNDASASRPDSDDQSPKTQDPRPKTFPPNPTSKIEHPKSEDGQLETKKQNERAAADGPAELHDDAAFDPIIPQDDNDEKMVIVVLRPTVPGAELTVEDGQLAREAPTQTSGP